MRIAEDKSYFEILKKNIEPLVRNHELEIWHDEKINPSENWLQEIERALLHAWSAILIISPDFIASEFITNIEIPRLLINAKEKGCKILCLYAKYSVVKHISWDIENKSFNLTDFQGLNSPEKPLSSLSKSKQDKVMIKSTEAILNLE
ncbi:MAG: internalin A [Saprospiraceae bacterium]